MIKCVQVGDRMKADTLKEIMNTLMNSEDFLSSQDLAFIVGVSDRSIRYEINQHRNLLEKYGLEIISKPKLGYKLKVNSNTLAMEFMKNIDFLVQRDVGDVKYYILIELLFQDNYVLVDDLSDRYYVSRSTVYRIIKQLEDIVDAYDLKINSISQKGIKVEGHRRNRIRCLKDYCMNALLELRELSLSEYQEIKYEITLLVFKALDKEKYYISESNANNLIVHIMMMLELNDRGLDATSCQDWDLNERSLQAAKRIADELKQSMNIEVSHHNIFYMAIHLQSKELVLRQAENSYEYLKVINNILAKIRHQLGYNFLEDEALIDDLSLHFEPMLFRIKHGLEIDDSLVADIKLTLHEGYECALIGASVIEQMYQLEPNEAEMGLLALHFAVAFERLIEKKDPKVLLITSEAVGIISLLRKRMAEELQLVLSQLSVMSFNQALEEDLNSFDLVFSTLPFAYRIHEQIIYIENPLTFNFKTYKNLEQVITDKEFFSEEDIHLVKGLRTKEETLSFLVQTLKNEHDLSSQMIQSIYDREARSTTEIPNSIALPHAMMRTDKTIVKFIVLDQAVQWNQKNVQCIIFVSHALGDLYTERYLNEKISQFVTNFDKVRDFLEDPTYQNIKDLLL